MWLNALHSDTRPTKSAASVHALAHVGPAGRVHLEFWLLNSIGYPKYTIQNLSYTFGIIAPREKPTNARNMAKTIILCDIVGFIVRDMMKMRSAAIIGRA